MADHETGRAGSRAATADVATSTRDDRSLPDLIRELGGESSRLVREEVELAKAEMREKLEVYERNLLKMLIGGALLLGAAAVLLVAVNRGLTVLLGEFMAAEVAVWLAPLILAVLAAAIGWGLVKAAQRAMKKEGVTPRQTVETLRQETEWAKREAKEVRHG